MSTGNDVGDGGATAAHDDLIGTILDEFAGETAAVVDRGQLEELHARYLGRKRGKLTAVFQGMRDLDPEARKAVGNAANRARQTISARLEELASAIDSTARRQRERAETLDVTLPGLPDPMGSLHPITQTLHEIESVFVAMGYEVVDGPEVETDWYNFGALNFPDDHPARDAQDTLHLQGDLLLRTHTSPVQVRYMETHQPPFAIIVPGKVFRRDTPDATHTPMFVQCEGLVVDHDITLADLKGTLDAFAKRLFGPICHIDPVPAGLLPLHGALGRGRRHLPGMRRHWLSRLQGLGLGRDAGVRDGPPCRVRERRLRP